MIFKITVINNKLGITRTVEVDSTDLEYARFYAKKITVTEVVADALSNGFILNLKQRKEILNSTVKDILADFTAN